MNTKTTPLLHRRNFLTIILSVFATILLSCAFIVQETETVFLLELGRVIRIVDKPGLHFHIPLIQEVVRFDRRISQTDSPAREVISLDQKRLVIDAYTKYKIVNPQIFFQSLKDDYGADNRIKSILDSSLRQVIASHPMTALLTEQRSEIMKTVKDILVRQTKSFGIEIIDARIVRADLPMENSAAIFDRMRTERHKEAQELRAQGEEEAQIIKSIANREVRSLIATANMNATIIRGKADGKAAEIYSTAFSKDQEFFLFYRTMEAYRTSLKSDNTRIMLSMDNDFLRLMKNTRSGQP